MSDDNQVPSADISYNEQFARGMAAFEKYDFAASLAILEQLPPFARPPLALSAMARCIAETRGEYKVAANLCHEAIKKDPKNTEHYFHQGRILILAGRKKDAIWVFRMGLRHSKHKGIIDALGELGIRRPPPIQFLERSNPVNKMLGIIMARLNLR